MKVAISVPDALFSRAEAVATRLGLSRSELYSRALAALLARQSADEITAALDRVHARAKEQLDPALDRAQRRALPREKW